MPPSLHTFSDDPIGPVTRLRRVSRRRETSRDVVLRAVPRGSTRAAHGHHVQKALLEHPEYTRRYASAKATLRAVLDRLVARADYETMTTRPGWDYLAQQTGKSRRTIARTIADLASMGLLGTVASGRTAAYASLNEDGERTNEAAVYVLCVPSPLQVMESRHSGPVDEYGTPPALGGSHLNNLKETHTRARGKDLTGAATPPELIPGGYAAATPPTPHRPELLWPAHKTTASKIQRLAAASELRRRVFVLRPMSLQDIRAVVRNFLLCGWTVADLHHALDFQPDGSPWPHNGLPAEAEAGRLRGLLRYRLGAYRTGSGEPLRSRDQRLANEAAENRAVAVKATQEATRARQERANRLGQDSPAKVVALASIRAMLDRRTK